MTPATRTATSNPPSGGSRSNTRKSGRSSLSARDSQGWSSMAAWFASHMSTRFELHNAYRTSRLADPACSVTVFTHEGAYEGVFFW